MVKTILITYDPNDGLALPDGKIKAFVDSVIEHSRDGLELAPVASELIVNEFRIRHMRGEIDVTFSFDGAKFKPHPSGRFDRWPEGFCDTWDNQLRALLDGSFKK